MPKISVVTLTQDRPEWLEEAILSVENQTEQDYEHLVYDNGSQANKVREVLEVAKKRRPEQFFFTSPGGRGGRGPDIVGFYWNVMLGLARGQFLTILDDDNRKKPTFFADMIAPMDADATVDAVSCGWSPIDAKGNAAGEDRHWNTLTTMPKLWQSNTIDSNAFVVRRAVFDRVGQFDPKLSTNEDWHFIARLTRAGKWVHLPQSLLEYREHEMARSRRAVALGAYANWQRIRTELFTEEERRIATTPPQ